MKRTAITAVAVTLVALISLWGIGRAQTGGGYDLSRWVIGGGGGTSQGGGYSLSGTIGQPLTSESTGGGYTLQSGFWPGVAAPCAAPNVTVALSSPNVQFTWSGGGTYNLYRAVDDPYLTGGSLESSNQSSGFTYSEALLGNSADNAYYLLGPAANCGERLGEFDFGITPGA